MPPPRPLARWSLISTLSSKARSSHCVSVTNTGTCLVYAGELKPRTPIDDSSDLRGCLHTFDLKSLLGANRGSGGTSVQDRGSILSPGPSSVPQPRVGAASTWSVRDKAMYMWGGRGGVDMAPLGKEEAGMWKATLQLEGGGEGVRWERADAPGEEPESRSYHTIVSLKDHIYVHAGCPTTGRVGSLQSFNVVSRIWKELACAPEPGRGGTALAIATLKNEGDVLLRFGGFAGYELPKDNTLDIYTITTNTWRTLTPSPDPQHGYPGPRSVHGFHSFTSPSPSLSNAIAILWHGEREASALGHAGAGAFWDDVWVLLDKPESDGTEWMKVSVDDVGEGGKPEGRGWFEPAGWVDEKGEMKIVMFGGLVGSNERSGELWVLEVE
ncbi:hypothetical protein JAAARDRAFT_59159 [Jaapia argillacea MUCL 33604]|uniref:Galactose oxidase n=1 Tax=Jaapia argillacea MUCL 33604 TaxID=933084 RepID=A0A067PR17_9AGAM|nr:hypothetical protein JAAARDRAFT_59159 [Jaapia argillacea MUCL 33604]